MKLLFTALFILALLIPASVHAEPQVTTGGDGTLQPVITLEQMDQKRTAANADNQSLSNVESQIVQEGIQSLETKKAFFEPTPDVRDRILYVAHAEYAYSYSYSQAEAPESVSDKPLSPVQESAPQMAKPAKPGMKIEVPLENASENENVVKENAKKNRDLVGLVAKTGLTPPITRANYNKLFPKNELPVSLMEQGLKNVTEYTKNELAEAKKQVEKKTFDKDILAKKEMLDLLKNQFYDPSVMAAPEDISSSKQYEALDTAAVSKELAAVHFLMNPPKHIHPYLRLLLYRRLVTPEVAYWYFKNLEKIQTIYQKAKEGHGKIRYKGKILDAYLPLPDEMGGSYELVVPSETSPEAASPAPKN